ncbi:MAG: hypothetical protein ACTSYH_03710 [Candidatus Heimdallarchaeaceae archaeon]
MTFFHEETPLELIKQIKPDVLVKGGDWSKDGVVGRDFVESYNGRVETIKFLDGYSTSDIVKRIK